MTTCLFWTRKLPVDDASPGATALRRKSAPTAPMVTVDIPQFVMTTQELPFIEQPADPHYSGDILLPEQANTKPEEAPDILGQPNSSDARTQQHDEPTRLAQTMPTDNAVAEIQEGALVVPGEEEDEDGFVLIGNEFVTEALSGSYDIVGRNSKVTQ